MSPLMENEKKVNHILHLLLTLFTCFFWAPMWMLICLSVSLENRGIKKRNLKRYKEQEKMLMYNRMQMMNSK